MSRSQSLKRKQPESSSPAKSLTEHERFLYEVIRSKKDMGIWTRDMKRETNLPDNVVNKSLKALQAKNLIKEVVNIQNKGRKHFMAAEFEPSKEITGGEWYSEGSLDKDFIAQLKLIVDIEIKKMKVATFEGVVMSIKKNLAVSVDLTKKQIEEILSAMVLGNEIMEVNSNGMGEFASIPVGKVCYKSMTRQAGHEGEPRRTGAMTCIPCGVCPRISLCTPGGIISPTTCVYYNKWLDF